MNNIKRIITATLLIPLVVIFLYYTNQEQFALISILIFSLILREWNYIANIYYKGFIWIAWIIFIALAYWTLKHHEIAYLYFICFFWLFLFLLVCLYPKINLCKSVIFRAVSLMVMVFGSWLALNQLFMNYEPHHIMFMLLLVWSSDTGGYFIGRKFGGVKLSAFVSPNKTIAGLIGSFIFGISLALIMMPLAIKYLSFNYLTVLGLAILIVIISVFGDLVESMFKRELGIKESGSLIPGHGGIVDRTDSLVATIPFYLLALFLIQSIT